MGKEERRERPRNQMKVAAVGKVILLVEDNPMDAALMLRALKTNGISNDVVVAADGVEALDYLFGESESPCDANVHSPQVVFLDLKLPRVDGFSVLRRIRADERTSQLPVIVISSSDEERDSAQASALGANNYFRKPVDFDEFVDIVGELGRRWLDG